MLLIILIVALASLAAGTLSADDAANRQSALPSLLPCDPNYPYRTFDGSCNNLNNLRYGQANTIYQRLIASATYADGISAIRLSQSGSALPSTRLVSTTVTVNSSVPNNDATFITMQWGQFMDHDLTQTKQFTVAGGCCTPAGSRFGNASTNPDPQCLYIPIPSNDPVYSNVNCMNFIRSTYGLNLDGTTPPAREQINTLTHWIDGSMIYGNSDSVAQSLRDTSSGKGLLAVSIQNGRSLLPTSQTPCTDVTSCSTFVAGDSRVREQPLLTVMHTIWMREHNRVANALYAKFGATKTDEFYYQEARRIVIAEFQHITYKEYLSVILGPKAKDFPSSNGPSNPAIYNEFAAAAYRMGHSQLKSFIQLIEADGSESSQSYFLGNSFNTGTFRLLNPTFIDNALRGLLQTPVSQVDECFPDDVTSQLFRGTAALGGDLISINMQRGRDHGLPPYIIARNIASGSSKLPKSFKDLKSTHSDQVIADLQTVYGSVADIDLYIGGVTEKQMPGAAVGPTFGYIIASQFQNLKISDRFFYSDLSQPISFTQNQLNEIKKVSLARIICDNSDGTITQIQPNAFRNPTGNNQPVSCSSINGIDFNKFYATTTASTSSEEDNSVENN